MIPFRDETINEHGKIKGPERDVLIGEILGNSDLVGINVYAQGIGVVSYRARTGKNKQVVKIIGERLESNCKIIREEKVWDPSPDVMSGDTLEFVSGEFSRIAFATYAMDINLSGNNIRVIQTNALSECPVVQHFLVC